MGTPSIDPYQFLLELFFGLVPEAKTLADLPELEARAQDIVHGMVHQAQSGINPPAESGETFGELREQLDAVINEILLLSFVSSILRFYAERRTPDRWTDGISVVLGKYKINPTKFEEMYQTRVEAAIREAFPGAFTAASGG